MIRDCFAYNKRREIVSLIEGSQVPAFEAKTTNGKTVQTYTFDAESKPIVLYFYPRDNTPGCTQESCDFRDYYADFEKLGVTIYGISRDTLTSHEKFKQKYQFPFELIADPDETVCQLFNVMVDKNMYGKKVRGIERSTYIIDQQGIIQKIWRKVKVENHVNEVLTLVKELLA
jgi:peroxiredoxin Q/BCP